MDRQRNRRKTIEEVRAEAKNKSQVHNGCNTPEGTMKLFKEAKNRLPQASRTAEYVLNNLVYTDSRTNKGSAGSPAKPLCMVGRRPGSNVVVTYCILMLLFYSFWINRKKTP